MPLDLTQLEDVRLDATEVAVRLSELGYRLTLATHSISSLTPLGSPATATVARAGRWSPKWRLYTSFMAVKSAMSTRKTVVLTTVANEPSGQKQRRHSLWVRLMIFDCGVRIIRRCCDSTKER